MSDYYSGEERRARRERFCDSNSLGNSNGRMVSLWLDAVSVAATTTTSQYSGAGTPREVITRTQVSEAIFRTFSQEVRDLSSIPTSTITRLPQPHPHPPTLAFHFDPPSAFDSYDTTPSTSALPSPFQQIRSSSTNNQEPALAQASTSLSPRRRSRVQSEHRPSASSVLEQRFTRYSSAPGRIAAGEFRRVPAAGAGIQRTLGDIELDETDAIRSFWAEIGTESRRGSDDEYAYVAGPGGAGVEDADPEEDVEGGEYLNELANELNYRLEYPDITQTSVVAPAWSDASSSTSSGSSLSSGGLTDWGIATPTPLFLDEGSPAVRIAGRDTSAERAEGGGGDGDADAMQENPLLQFDQITGFSSPYTLPPIWVDTPLAPFVFPPSPAREVPSIFPFSPPPRPLAPTFTPGIYPIHTGPLTQSQELENWTMQNIEEYSYLLSASTSASTSSTLPYNTFPIPSNVPQNPTATDSTACPICYENPVTREFPCSIHGAQHGLCGPCFAMYEGYCTEVVRCPLCRHEFFGSQVVVVGCEVNTWRGGEEEGVGLVGGDEGFEVGSEVDGEHEVVDEEEVEFYTGGYVL